MTDLSPPPDLAAQLDELAVWAASHEEAALLCDSATHIRAQAARIAELEFDLGINSAHNKKLAHVAGEAVPLIETLSLPEKEFDPRALQAKRGEDG